MIGPKHKLFEHGVFIQIRPVRVGDKGTRPKNSKTIIYVIYSRNDLPFHTQCIHYFINFIHNKYKLLQLSLETKQIKVVPH
jgi:hypothetical protein